MVQGGGEQPQHFWVALVAELGPLYDRVGALPGPWLDNLRRRVGIEAHPHQAPLLGTVCLCPTNFKGVLESYPARFKFRKMGKTERGHNAGFFKVRPGGLVIQGPLEEKYLHDLLCWMYRGPPADPSFECIRLCETKTCLCPWHLWWGPRSQNVSGHQAHKRKRTAYHDPRALYQQRCYSSSAQTFALEEWR